MEPHCHSCNLSVCPDCAKKVKQITFGCGHQGCNTLVMEDEEEEEEEEGGGGGAGAAVDLTAEEHPHCPKCHRAQEKAAALAAATAKSEQLKKDLPADIALVKSILPQAKTSQLKQALTAWLANPNPQQPASKKRRY